MCHKLEFTQEVSIQHPIAAWNCTLCTLPQTSYDVLKARKGLIKNYVLDVNVNFFFLSFFSFFFGVGGWVGEEACIFIYFLVTT